MAKLPVELFNELASLIELEGGTFEGLTEMDGFFEDDLVVLESNRTETAVGFSQSRLRALDKRGLIDWGLEVKITDRGREIVRAAGGPGAEAPTRSDVLEALEHIEFHPAIDRRVRRAFEDEDPQHAVSAAFNAIEVQIRSALKQRGQPAPAKGAKGVVTTAFGAGGALADPERSNDEQIGVMQLFQGAIAAVRNPNAHGEPTYEPDEALRLVLFADHLLRTIPRGPHAHT